jgi:hypothetical protein
MNDPDGKRRIKELFQTLFKDKHGQPFFYEEEFQEGLRIFF